MEMKTISLILGISIILLTTGCSERESEHLNQALNFKNSTSQTVQIDTYLRGVLKLSETIESERTGITYHFLTEHDTFGNFSNISDSLIIKFPDGRGYICSSTATTCITDRPTPFSGSKNDFIQNNPTFFSYELKESDIGNAYQID